jgi:hypothetical protein
MSHLVTVSYALGSDVRVDLTGSDDVELLHYGTVCGTKRLPSGAALHRVSGLPGRWIHATRLVPAPRPRESETEQ